ncbi:MAG: SusD/RagB family nutrient-binding outer membrane lipoprotein [Ferruginibacter sp.]
MKKISFKITALTLAAGLIIGGTGCDKIKDFGTTNVNPLVTQDPIPSALLTNVEAGLGAYATQTQPGYYVQYFAENQYATTSLYSSPIADFAGSYSGSLYDLQNIINYNSDPKTASTAGNYGSNNNQIATARILKQYIFWNITDRWGDIPYTEALQGVTPNYTKQQDIYKGMIAELKAAVAQFDGGNGPKGDIIYNGNVAQWKKLANSMRMLMALRLSKRFPNAGDYSATEFAAAVADPAGHIVNNADNMILAYPGGAYSNPWYNFYVISSRKDYAVSKTFTDLMTGLGDVRNQQFGGIAAGTVYGVSLTSPPNPFDTVMNAKYRAAAAPVFIIRASSVLLAKAEAAERGWITGGSATAQTYYESGVTASFTQWDHTAVEAASYYNSPTVKYGSGTGVASIGGSTVPGSNAVTTTNLQRIALQRYIAYFPDGAQGWAEWRRTGIPDVKPTINAVNTGKQIPRRYTYGQSEYSTNPTGVAEGIATLTGGDTQDAHVWWDL